VSAIIRGDEPVIEKRWEGTWAGVSVVNNGERMPDERAQKLRLTLTADRYKTELGDQVLFDSTYTVDATKSPAHIDIIGTEGDLKGKSALGLLTADGDTLTLCYVMPGSDRPAALESPAGSRITLLVMKRFNSSGKSP
jgi:uncharacterized protein (TIGR03067 family)